MAWHMGAYWSVSLCCEVLPEGAASEEIRAALARHATRPSPLRSAPLLAPLLTARHLFCAQADAFGALRRREGDLKWLVANPFWVRAHTMTVLQD